MDWISSGESRPLAWRNRTNCSPVRAGAAVGGESGMEDLGTATTPGDEADHALHQKVKPEKQEGRKQLVSNRAVACAGGGGEGASAERYPARCCARYCFRTMGRSDSADYVSQTGGELAGQHSPHPCRAGYRADVTFCNRIAH